MQINKLTSILMILFALAVAGVLIFATNIPKHGEAMVYSESTLLAMEKYYDFGDIQMKGGDVTHRFELTNIGPEDLVVKNIFTSCMCTEAWLEDASGGRYGAFGMPGHGVLKTANVKVNSGESVFIDAVFDPAAHGPAGVGLAQRSIYLETNSRISSRVELSFQAIVEK